MKETILKHTSICLAILFLFGCSNVSSNDFSSNPESDFQGSGTSSITDDGSTTDYTDTTTASPSAVISEDLYENFAADGTVYISLNGKTWSSSTEGSITDSDVTITETESSEEDENAAGLEIQYKGKLKIKYVLSGTYTGTIFIKNKKADAAVVLNNTELKSENGAGPVLRFSSEQRTFIVVPAGTTNTLKDTRRLNQSKTMYDDKKGSVYSKGALIFTGETSDTSGGSLTITNSGYKHAVYSKDYIRVADITLTVNAAGETSRDCLRALTAVIIDGGNISLTGKGTIEDDESVGIKVEGEDADEDDLTVEYTAGAGFVIINGGKLTINTVAKGITAHWKSSESVIGDASYTETANQSLLYTTFLDGTTAATPNPYVEINGGTISITTTGEPYEGRTDSDPSCSPEGIEAKGNLTINAGTITLNCTDDAINAGGNVTINGGAVYAYSSKNDAIDANGSSGITINGGVIVALGLNTPECAFDCDQNPLKINGGTLIGLGTSNYTAPSKGKQSVIVLSSRSVGSANSSFAVTDESGNPVFVYSLPSSTGEVLVLSSPDLKTGTTYSVKTGVTVSGGTRFHSLYTSLPSISGGSTSLSNVSTSSSNTVYTDSNVSSGFGGPGAGGPGR